MARIRQEDIEAVKERTDIVALVGQYLTLKKSGHDSLTGLCPFHQEKTGSFSVSPSKQVFYCFGCGKGGDAITFLRELEHLSYVEAIERLAGVAGVSLRFEGDSPAERRKAERRKALYRANEQAAELFVAMLRDGQGGRRRARLPDGARHHARGARATFQVGLRARVRRLPAAAPRRHPRPVLRGAARSGSRHAQRRRHGARPVPRADHVPDQRSAGALHRVRRARRAVGRTRRRAGQVPQHRGDADLPQARGALQHASRASGGGQGRRGVRGRGLHRRDRPHAGGASRTSSPRAGRRWGRSTSNSCPGSPSARSCRSTPTRRARGRPSERSSSRRSSRSPRWC